MFTISFVTGSKKAPIKREKGRSILNAPNDYIVLDLETTGLDPRWDEIIEVACLKFADGKQVDSFHSYVQPRPFYGDDDQPHFVDEFITDLTGITDDMLKDAPRFESIAQNLFQYLGNSVIIGHNVNFDINFLYDNFLKTIQKPFSNDFVDTLRIARLVMPELDHHRLKDLCQEFSIDTSLHRAANDCAATQEILVNLQRIAVEKGIDLATYRPRYKCHNINLSTLTGDTTLNDPAHPLYGKNVVFTGKLQRFVRKDAAQIVCNIGGHCENNVTKKTNFLVIGSLEGNPLVKGGQSTKMKRAKELILAGQDLQVLSETVFYDMLNDYMQ